MMFSPRSIGLASLGVCLVFASGAVAQQNAPETVRSSQAAPLPGNSDDATSATTGHATPAGTMSKSELKSQRAQQKRDESASRANVKAAKAHAAVLNSQAKSKEANDKALQAQEKAGQVIETPAATDTPAGAPQPSTPQ
jgi:hypothetical protein